MATNDYKMERLINELKEFKAEKQRIIDTSKEMIEFYKLKIEQCNESLGLKLMYIEEQISNLLEFDEMKETKTGYNYVLPSAKIVITKEKFDMKLKNDDLKLEEIPDRFIKTERKVKWGDFKKLLVIDGGNVINTQTGEIVESVEVEKVEGGKINLKLSD